MTPPVPGALGLALLHTKGDFNVNVPLQSCPCLGGAASSPSRTHTAALCCPALVDLIAPVGRESSESHHSPCAKPLSTGGETKGSLPAVIYHQSTDFWRGSLMELYCFQFCVADNDGKGSTPGLGVGRAA